MLGNGDVLGADSIILDLEDAVSPDEKDSARILVRNALKYLHYKGCEIIIRINDLETPYWEKDLEAVMPYRPDVLLDDALIRELWQKQNVPEHIIRHMQAVAECAGQILSGCRDLHDSGRIRRACLLHDLCRLQPHHAGAAADLLKKEGFTDTAAMIEGHHREEYDPEAALSDADIVWYADKCVLEDRIVTIEERFAESRKKCLSEEALMHHQRRYEKALWIRQMLEREKNHETDEN